MLVAYLGLVLFDIIMTAIKKEEQLNNTSMLSTVAAVLQFVAIDVPGRVRTGTIPFLLWNVDVLCQYMVILWLLLFELMAEDEPDEAFIPALFYHSCCKAALHEGSHPKSAEFGIDPRLVVRLGAET